MRRLFYARPNGRALAANPIPDAWSPRVDVVEEKGGYRIRLDLPGIDEKAVQVRFDDGELLVEGERAASGNGVAYVVRERPKGAFRRGFRLSEAVDADHIEARYDRGVLEIRVPIVDRSRRIPIQ